MRRLLIRSKFLIEVPEATVIPKGYGIVYWDYSSLTAVCAPIPSNLLIGLVYTIYTICKRGIVSHHDIKIRREAYDRGFQDGRVTQIVEKL